MCFLAKNPQFSLSLRLRTTEQLNLTPDGCCPRNLGGIIVSRFLWPSHPSPSHHHSLVEFFSTRNVFFPNDGHHRSFVPSGVMFIYRQVLLQAGWLYDFGRLFRLKSILECVDFHFWGRNLLLRWSIFPPIDYSERCYGDSQIVPGTYWEILPHFTDTHIRRSSSSLVRSSRIFQLGNFSHTTFASDVAVFLREIDKHFVSFIIRYLSGSFMGPSSLSSPYIETFILHCHTEFIVENSNQVTCTALYDSNFQATSFSSSPLKWL